MSLISLYFLIGAIGTIVWCIYNFELLLEAIYGSDIVVAILIFLGWPIAVAFLLLISLETIWNVVQDSFIDFCMKPLWSKNQNGDE